MKTIFILILLIFSTSFGQIQHKEAIITDKITNEIGEVLPSANIRLIDNNIGTTSDSRGNFSLITKPGKYILEVSHVGYEKYRTKISLSEGSKFI